MGTSSPAKKESDALIPRQWPWLYERFKGYCRGYLPKHFNSVRLAHAEWPVDPVGEPLIIAFNHPSWWDPIIAITLSAQIPNRVNYGPIDAKALGKYGFFRMLGFFGVEQGTRRGGLTFLRTSEAILEKSATALWVTAQGRFTDVRERPLQLRGGIGHLVHRMPRCVVLPLAIEYPFWTERLPEALARFGKPIVVTDGSSKSVDEWVAIIEEGLTVAQEALAADAVSRNADAFRILLGGRAGVGGIYDIWRRFKAMVQGKKFVAEHGSWETQGKKEGIS